MITKRPFLLLYRTMLGFGLLKQKNGEKKSLEVMIWTMSVILTNDKLVFGEAVFCQFK